jgi:hypothetical protein
MHNLMTIFIICIGLSAVGALALLVHFFNSRGERQAKKLREEKEQERIRLVQEKFKGLGAKLITNSEHQAFAFRTLFDASREFTGKQYSYPLIRYLNFGNLYFVVNGAITSPHELEIVAAYVREFFTPHPNSTSWKKPFVSSRRRRKLVLKK